MLNWIGILAGTGISGYSSFPDMGYKSGYETKKKIYHSALRLFTKHGYYKTTMRMIAAEAEVNLGLCHYHYKKKESIVKKFYHQYHRYVKEYINRHLPPENLFQELLLELGVNYTLLFNSRLILTLFLEGVTVTDLTRQYPGAMLKYHLSEELAESPEQDASYYRIGSIILCSTSQALYRNWREKALDRPQEDLMRILLKQMTYYFGIEEAESDTAIEAVLHRLASLDGKKLEEEVLEYCFGEESFIGDD